MKLFFSIVRKEFHHIFRDRWTLAILLLLPLLMLTLFGYAITTEVKGAHLAVFDPSQDPSSRELTEKLKTSEYFTVSYFLSDSREIQELFRKGQADLVVIFSDRFEEKLNRTGRAQIQLLTDGTDPNKAATLVNYASGIISLWQKEKSPLMTVPYRIQPEIKLLYNPSMKGAYNFVPGVMGMILMLICAMMTSISIAREKETGTMEILLVSPVKPLAVILAKTVPYFFVSVFNLMTILVLSFFVLKVPIAGSLVLLVLVSLLFILVSLSLGLLISTMVKTQQAALLISGMALMIPVILLSGMLFPLENMPRLLRLISHLIPARWYILAVKKIMIKGVGFSEVMTETAVLAGMAFTFLVLSLKKFKLRLE